MKGNIEGEGYDAGNELRFKSNYLFGSQLAYNILQIEYKKDRMRGREIPGLFFFVFKWM